MLLEMFLSTNELDALAGAVVVTAEGDSSFDVAPSIIVRFVDVVTLILKLVAVVETLVD